MIKQEVVWHSVKEDGAPKAIGAICITKKLKKQRIF